jgi:tetratricopeptide (TPR) repeat protein
VEIRPGSVRAARKAAGLTLAQLAGSELSKAAIHLVENGRSRPSMPTLKLIASRTNRPLSYFLRETGASPTATRARSQVLELEELCVTEQFTAALELGRKLLPELVEPRDEAQARLCLGQACVHLRDPEQAYRQLTAAHALFDELSDPFQVVECQNWEAAALQLQEDPRALEVAEEALSRCRQLDPVPAATEVSSLTNLAAVCASRQEWARAISTYEAAIEAAGSLGDLRRMAGIYSGLAAAYRDLGDLSVATRHADRAIALHSINRDSTARARLENSLGLLHLQKGALDIAERHLQSSLRGFEEHGLETGRIDSLLSLGELYSRRGDSGRAEEFVATAMELARGAGERLGLARGHVQLGRLQEAGRRRAQADRSFAAAIRILSELGVTERLIECHATYAEILEKRGSTRRALEHWKRAMALTRTGG